MTTIKTITGDSDSLLEVSEKMQIHIDLKQINSAHVKLAHTVHKDVYGEPYMSLRLEIRPVVGAVLTIEKEIPGGKHACHDSSVSPRKGSLNFPTNRHCFSYFYASLT